MSPSPGQPVRTCVGCGQPAARTALVRLRARGGSVVVDAARSGGRGAWLHPAGACLDRALARRAFARALRAEVQVDAQAIRTELTVGVRRD
ncbi:MAG TPA: DUF448 domain-containing protein [Anaeromyxobacter sp.]|nr:DUF448 domain-containing protein [Anaeromyxobacter sp.]